MVFVYWLHLLATITWIGGLATLAFLVQPVARKSLSGDAYQAFSSRLQSRLQQVGWFSLAILIVTGMFQMSYSPSYKGLLAIENPWAVAILLKHGVIGIMLLLGIYQTWFLNSAIQRAAFAVDKGLGGEGALIRLQQREVRLNRMNLVVGIVILALTAWARVS
jgi:uncharacterized membrane protein